MSAEFELIAKYFTRACPQVDLSIGDDAALTQVASGHQLVISTDMSVVGTHFFADAPAYDVGWKSLAVNVSDIAAMGASPRWATLALAMPKINHDWLGEFSRGFFACADAYDVALIGGDTTRGELNISVTILGEIPIGQALKRSGAKQGDDIWVSGTLGDAALALAIKQERYALKENAQAELVQTCVTKLNQPQPRIALGKALLNIAHSCIDISDGLIADLGHILKASQVGANIYLEQIPVSKYCSENLEHPLIQQCVLSGGDDYELCFTAPTSARPMIQALGQLQNLRLSRIGEVQSELGLRLIDAHQQTINLARKGYDHFE